MLDQIVSNNIDTILFIPVIRRYWKQHELWDGTYSFSDFMDILEAIDVFESNKSIVIQSIMSHEPLE